MMSPTTATSNESAARKPKPVTRIPSVIIRFAGDSGDGMQLAGTQFSDTSAVIGNDIATFPDYPAEIRAPAGTLAGVSGFQVHFSSNDIFTPGDEVDVLVAMNPAALKSNLKFVKKGGLLLANEDAFAGNDLKRAGYDASPLDDGSLSGYRLVKVPINSLNEGAVKEFGLSPKQVDRCKNFFALGLAYWLYDRPLDLSLQYITEKFGKTPALANANAATLRAGYAYGETVELLPQQYQVEKAKMPPGTYRKVTGNEAVALGMAVAGALAGKELFYASYPITPASEILHGLSDMKNFNVMTFQAEDEICAMGAAVGAAYGGTLSATGTSGPGMALKTEAIGLAVMTELPVVIVNVQRGGPSTGLPTKTEQADLFQAVYGRNGECPVPVIAAASPSDCFNATVEAFRLAVKYMTPVILLSDGYLANGAEPWMVPDFNKLEKIVIKHPSKPANGEPFRPYKRDESGARPWAVPGTPGLEHRIGGLEKADVTGAVSYDPANHERMIGLRAQKVAGVKPVGEPYFWTGPEKGKLLLVSWGSTYGFVKAATIQLLAIGASVAHCHLRYLNPLPGNLGELLKNFGRILIPEMNLGQLRMLLQAKFLIEAQSLSKVRGQPFTIQEIVAGAKKALE